ncbi:hypothetical protein [Archangium primigenium]|uniref:hypothetical protein n=1 Tax=[Archangium] primigenium TaxID=2792470 RepID=UPI00195A4FEF|nr:hypothetical protein [Archangium primigenium]
MTLVLGGPLLLAGCAGCPTPLISDLVIITYEQRANFNHWKLLDQEGTIEDGVFVRYRIVSIQNNDTHAKTFHFDPGKIYAEEPSQTPIPFIYLAGALPFDIPPGAPFTRPLGLTLRIPGVPGVLKNEPFPLHYASGPDEHVLIIPGPNNPNPPPYANPFTQGGV